MGQKIATRDAYGKAILKLAEANQNVVVLNADLSSATKTTDFGDKYPDRAFNMGIAEQNMIGFAVGLSTTGLIPFAGTFAVFAAGRDYDQIRQSVAYSKANVKIVATHGGITVGADGATHQAIEDIALMRALPNLTVIVPADAVETEKALASITEYEGPVYLRLGREPSPVIMSEAEQFQIGKAVEVRAGKDLTFITAGLMVSMALEAAEILESQSVKAGVVDMHTIKPLDGDAITAAAKTGRIITAEEHSLIGGLGGAVDEFLIQNRLNRQVRVVNVGIDDQFGQTGSAQQLLEAYQLTPQRLVDEAIRLMKE
jgi:transketolase